MVMIIKMLIGVLLPIHQNTDYQFTME